jgi:hypothetical protein
MLHTAPPFAVGAVVERDLAAVAAALMA